MSRRIREHLRSNVVGYIAIFLFAIGGTAYATHPGGANTISSLDIINSEVSSADLAQNSVNVNKITTGAVRTAEIANTAVHSIDVMDNNLTGDDIADNSSLGSAEVGNLNGGDITDGSLTGADVADNTITGADISDGFRSAAAAADATVCNDDDNNGEVCATTNITLNETARVLAIATGGWHTHGTSGRMSCLIDHDGFETIGTPQTIGEVGANHPIPNDGTLALTGISAPIGTGTHAISLICTQQDADLDLSNANLTVVAVDE